MAERPAAARLFLPVLIERREYGLLAMIALTVVVVTAVNPRFVEPVNIRDILVRCAPVAIVACGLMLVIVTAEIDISVGSMMGLLATCLGLLASVQHAALPVAAAVALTLLLGLGIGLLNGLLVTLGGVPSIIVTLGMLSALRGVNRVLMGGEWITGLPPGLRYLGTGALLGVPVPICVAALVILATAMLIHHTPLGRRVYAVGSDVHAARLAGLPERRIKLFVFTATGFLTALATVVSAPQQAVVESGIGVDFELLVVTCIVVGGVSIRGGRGTLAGVMLGVLLLMMIRSVLIFLKLGDQAIYWERAIAGAFILAAVLTDHLGRRVRSGGIDT